MKRIAILTLPLLGGAVLAFRQVPAPPEVEFTVPEGFAVQEVYAPDRAGTVVAITFDSEGRLVVARENGPIVTLIDNDGDGVIDQERAFTDSSTVLASQGLLFDGPDLLVVGRSQQGTGLFRVPDADGDGVGDGVELIELSTGGIQEHGPHAVFFGPDGYLYWTQGNFSFIYDYPSALSPVRGWENGSLLGRDDARGFGSAYTGGPGGNFMRRDLAQHARTQPQGGGGRGFGQGGAPSDEWELVSMGFRNQYDGAFNLMGELFTFDSDMEWHRDAPWYRPTRTIHVVPGGDYGYREGSHVHPEYYFDDLPGTEGQGRGSPTGVIVYNSYSYPAEYWDMVLQADWSRGRIVGSRISKSGASYSSVSDNFVYGEPLNVTDVEVGPDGNVYFALGGRNTSGGLYRVVYEGDDVMGQPEASTPLDRVLTLAQPRSAFSRQTAREVKDELGDAAWQQGLTAEVRNTGAAAERRVRAMELLQVFGPGMDENTLGPLAEDAAWEVRAAAAYYLGMKTSPSARRTLVTLLKDSDPFVQRRAAEALLRTGVHPMQNAPIDAVADVMPLLGSEDRFVRYAGRKLLEAIDPNEWTAEAYALDSYPEVAEALLAQVEILDDANVWYLTRLARRELELLQRNPSDDELLDLVRLIQRTTLKDHGVRNLSAAASTAGVGALPPPGTTPPSSGGGGRGQGGPGSVYVQMGQLLLDRFPAADTAVNREIARLLAYWEIPGTIEELTLELENSSHTREQQIHYAEMLSHIEEGWEEPAIERMTAWLEKVYAEDWRGGASFAGAINRIQDQFLAALPPAQAETLAARIEDARPQVAAAPTGGGFGPVMIAEEELFEELVYNPNIREGDPAGGVAAYEQALCATCHTFGPIGREFGPDLTTVNQRFSRRDLVRAVVFPHETVSDLWQVEQITRNNGQTVSGTIYNEDATSVTLQVPGTTQQVTVPKSDIRSRQRSEMSPMPEGLLNYLNGAQRRNLFLLLEAGPAAIPDSALTRMGVSR